MLLEFIIIIVVVVVVVVNLCLSCFEAFLLF